MTDISFDKKTIENLKSLIGKTLERYSADPFVNSPTVFGIVGFRIDNRCFRMTARLEPTNRFFSHEDVAVLNFVECEAQDIVSFMDKGKLTDTPVNDTVVGIDVVCDHEVVVHDGVRKEFISTKGIIFHMASGNEISFEVGSWFSEMITIRRGCELRKLFTPQTEFLEEWEGYEGYTPECSREVISY